jgi:DNA-binding XRE family transcriptional regulator
MKIHPQIIVKNNIPVFIVLPYKEYEGLLDSLEDQEDIEEVQLFHTGSKETIPFELLQSITNGESAVRVFREFRKISQTTLAKQIGISRQYLCQIEKNERKGRAEILKKIADTLDVDIDLLVS